MSVLGGFHDWISRGKFNAHIGMPEHFNGSLNNDEVVEITPTNSRRIMSVLVVNTHGSNDLYVKLDDGANYLTIGAGKSFSFSAYIEKFYLKGGGVSTTYESIVNYEP